MKAEKDADERLPKSDTRAIRVAVVYEDFASGTRAKHFAELLGKAFGSLRPLAESLWRCELLERSRFAEQAAQAAAGCDYLIVSIHGEHFLPLATRRWLEAQLDGAAERHTALIFLSDASRGKPRVLEGTRQYFRAVCAGKGVDFFCHVVIPPGNDTATNFCDEEETPGIEARVGGWGHHCSLPELLHAPRYELHHHG